jgi:hypothetical protein
VRRMRRCSRECGASACWRPLRSGGGRSEAAPQPLIGPRAARRSSAALRARLNRKKTTNRGFDPQVRQTRPSLLQGLLAKT